MEFRVLGALEVLHAGSALPLGGRKQRAVLARLLLDAGQAVSTDALISACGGRTLPLTPGGTLQVYVANLRRVLDINDGGDGDPRRCRDGPSGYLLNLLRAMSWTCIASAAEPQGRLLMGHDPPRRRIAAALLTGNVDRHAVSRSD